MIDKNIGFIGLGNVGSKLANSLLLAKYNLFIHDIDKNVGKKLIKKGAIWNNSIREIIYNSSIIITCLPSPKSVRDVIEKKNGILTFITKDHLWIEMSTTDEHEMIRLSKLIEKKGANVLEAPVTGGQHKAESGNISIFAGGKRKIFNRALPILSKIGFRILYCGKIGNASTLKVVTNFLASVNLLSLGEALMVCKKYGVKLNTAFQGIKISSGNSFVHETESQVILNGSYDIGFTMDLVCKDVNLFEKTSKKMRIPTEISPLLVRVFKHGKKKYGNKSFSTSIVKILEDKCGISLRAKGFPSKLKDLEKRKNGIEIKS
ncbi:MAG: 2-(hydroxymethyl)glutarate dehydrogenase [Alphaproteobacteria bacterium MarineAlpha5_Bin6]|nr:MAG: 2-(hydroxymethyl)glutarate dehydrogenase [Alphaproteobacteria bacterium MarineAlpha5_Bin7]PPR54499.1 MAG: 2-(hydroxymethyl)glutarate dehydrogenase [Alphaproteobacteria bacterium MarineAlpha5_Bin6]|tara:strand:+ start:425 stop:1381 length:957 start_codon:yes stop_codon:yes gene_type:complete